MLYLQDGVEKSIKIYFKYNFKYHLTRKGEREYGWTLLEREQKKVLQNFMGTQKDQQIH